MIKELVGYGWFIAGAYMATCAVLGVALMLVANWLEEHWDVAGAVCAALAVIWAPVAQDCGALRVPALAAWCVAVLVALMVLTLVFMGSAADLTEKGLR